MNFKVDVKKDKGEYHIHLYQKQRRTKSTLVVLSLEDIKKEVEKNPPSKFLQGCAPFMTIHFLDGKEEKLVLP